MKLTVFFDGQFWVGLIEQQTEGGLCAWQHIFGAQPRDEEILAFVNEQLMSVVKSSTVGVSVKGGRRNRINPKRMAREAAREMKAAPVSTQAQEALQAQLEERKRERRDLAKAQEREERERKRRLKQEKAKRRRRGR